MERAKIATQMWSEIVQTEKKRKDMRKRINKPRYQIQPARGDPKMVKIMCENIRKKERKYRKDTEPFISCFHVLTLIH